MSLLDRYQYSCTKRIPQRTSDGAGGFNVSWTDGDTFDASIVLERSFMYDTPKSREKTVAGSTSGSSKFSVYTDKDTVLSFHDVFKRTEDGRTFRVTSGGDCVTPEQSGLTLRLVSAEEWEET